MYQGHSLLDMSAHAHTGIDASFKRTAPSADSTPLAEDLSPKPMSPPDPPPKCVVALSRLWRLYVLRTGNDIVHENSMQYDYKVVRTYKFTLSRIDSDQGKESAHT